MLKYVIAFWGIVVVFGIVWVFIWLTKELPNCIHLVRNDIDQTAGIGIILWVLFLMVISLLVATAYEFVV